MGLWSRSRTWSRSALGLRGRWSHLLLDRGGCPAHVGSGARIPTVPCPRIPCGWSPPPRGPMWVLYMLPQAPRWRLHTHRLTVPVLQAAVARGPPQADAQDGQGSSFWRLQGRLVSSLSQLWSHRIAGVGTPLCTSQQRLRRGSFLSPNSSSVLTPAPTLTSASCSQGPTGRGLGGFTGGPRGRGLSLELGRGRCRGHDSACHTAPGGNSTEWQLQKQAWRAWAHQGLSWGACRAACAQPSLRKQGKLTRTPCIHTLRRSAETFSSCAESLRQLRKRPYNAEYRGKEKNPFLVPKGQGSALLIRFPFREPAAQCPVSLRCV